MWMDSFIISGYRKKGDMMPDDLYPLREESSPSDWTERFVTARQETGSTDRALWKLFRGKLLILATLMILCGMAEFTGAYGLRNLLEYMQGSPSAVFKPWFCVVLFSISPIIRGICMQTFESFSTHSIGHVKGLLASTV